jgi:hypothetical protein
MNKKFTKSYPEKENTGKAWIIAVDMGYGHQRTAYSLRHLAPEGKIINANNYEGMPKSDKKIWRSSRIFYEFISRFSEFPLIGSQAFSLYDGIFQKIPHYYPKRDLSEPNLTLKQSLYFIRKGWGRDLIKNLSKKPLPIIDTFFTAALMAEFFKYPNDIYSVVCDADISRNWAPLNPKKSRIKYFVPTTLAANRLIMYGVKQENIFLTGYPLPTENIGSKNLETLKHDLSFRLPNLDPEQNYFRRYWVLIKEYLGDLVWKSDHPLTIMFSVGGAGAQKRTGNQIIKSLAKKIAAGKIRIFLSAGTRKEVRRYFQKSIKKAGLTKEYGSGIKIIFSDRRETYFEKFNLALRTTDILWTKPSELSFYAGLGIPLILAPPIGSQEEINKKWLLEKGAGLLQEDPKYTEDWLFDALRNGRLARASLQGFIECEKMGVFNIQKIISKIF